MTLRECFTVLPFFAIFCACQTDAPKVNVAPKRIITVRATLPDSNNTRSYITYGDSEKSTRAQITYGNSNPLYEIFMWDKAGYGGLTQNDYIALYNVTRLSQCQPEGIQLDVIDTVGRTAIFESVSEVDPSVEFKAGDLVFVNYGATRIRQINNEGAYDERKIFTIDVGTESNKPQIIVTDPDNSSLAYMHHNLRLYDIVTVVEEDSIPDLHFKHLSAIFRITLDNQTGKDLYPTKLDIKYPETESFFNTTLYCSIDTTLSSGLHIYTDDELFKGSEPYTDNIGTTINNKDGTEDAGEVIKSGQTYELYLSTVPKIGNTAKGNKLIIDLIVSHDTDHPYRITLDNFDTTIKAGNRYWFKLTATPAGDFVLSSKYNPDDYKSSGTSDGENDRQDSEESNPKN